MRNAMTSQQLVRQPASQLASQQANSVQSSRSRSHSHRHCQLALAIKANSQKAFKPKVADDIVNNAAIDMEKPRVDFMRFAANFYILTLVGHNNYDVKLIVLPSFNS